MSSRSRSIGAAGLSKVITFPYYERDKRGNSIKVTERGGIFYVTIRYGRKNTRTFNRSIIPEGELVEKEVSTAREAKAIISMFKKRFSWARRGETHALIGQGAYGCIYSPALTCKDSTVSYPNAISKVLPALDAEKEARNMKVVDAIDPHGQYHLKLLNDPCDVPDDINLEHCAVEYKKGTKLQRMNKEDSKMLIYQHGGNPFSIFTAHKTPARLGILELIAFVNVFKALVVFNRNQFIHNDIKPENIVFTGGTQVRNPVLLKFIDFGSSMTYDTPWNDPRSYAYWPPQVYILNQITNSTRRKRFNSIKLDTGDVRRFAQEFALQSNTGVFGYEKEDTVNRRKVSNALIREIEEYNKMWNNPLSRRKRPQFLADIYKRHDIYGIGMTLYQTFDSLDSEIVRIPGFFKSYKNFVRHLIAPSLRERYSPEQALLEYTKLLQSIPAYIRPKSTLSSRTAPLTVVHRQGVHKTL